MILDAARLSASGRPELGVGEVELLLVDQVGAWLHLRLDPAGSLTHRAAQVDLQFEAMGGTADSQKPRHEVRLLCTRAGATLTGVAATGICRTDTPW